MFDRPTHRTTSRIFVVGNHRLIALINVSVNVPFMMIHDQHRPVLATVLLLAEDPLLPGLNPRRRLAAPICVRSGVERVLQHAVYRMVPSGPPDDLARIF